jgi:hypothetical protein
MFWVISLLGGGVVGETEGNMRHNKGENFLGEEWERKGRKVWSK